MLNKEEFDGIIKVLEEAFELPEAEPGERDIYEATVYWGIDLEKSIILTCDEKDFEKDVESVKIVDEKLVEMDKYVVILLESGDFAAYATDKYAGEINAVFE